MLTTLFEAAGRPDTIEITQDETRRVTGADVTGALTTQRQQAQRFLDTSVA